jgi:COMPASS component SWD3
VSTLRHEASHTLSSHCCHPHRGQGKQATAALSGHTAPVLAVDISPRGNVVVSGGYDEAVRLHDPRSRTPHRVLAAHSEPVTSAMFNGDGSLLATGSYDGLCRVWDVGTGLCLLTVHTEAVPPV